MRPSDHTSIAASILYLISSLVASVSSDATLRIWRIATGECLTTLHVDGALGQCAWFLDGSRLAAVGAAGLYLFELKQES
jgi:WD40 repeat protein